MNYNEINLYDFNNHKDLMDWTINGLELDNPNDKIISSICEYGNTRIISSIQMDNIFAVQFHPEKSQSEGIKLLKNFIEEMVDVKK